MISSKKNHKYFFDFSYFIIIFLKQQFWDPKKYKCKLHNLILIFIMKTFFIIHKKPQEFSQKRKNRITWKIPIYFLPSFPS
jgi:hypothetical protein